MRRGAVAVMGTWVLMPAGPRAGGIGYVNLVHASRTPDGGCRPREFSSRPSPPPRGGGTSLEMTRSTRLDNALPSRSKPRAHFRCGDSRPAERAPVPANALLAVG